MSEVTYKPQTVICKKCKHEYEMNPNVQTKTVARDIIQYLLVCPNCDEAEHCYFETPDIVAARARMQTALDRYNKAVGKDKVVKWEQFVFQRSVFNTKFKKEQKNLKRKYHIADRQLDREKEYETE